MRRREQRSSDPQPEVRKFTERLLRKKKKFEREQRETVIFTCHICVCVVSQQMGWKEKHIIQFMTSMNNYSVKTGIRWTTWISEIFQKYCNTVRPTSTEAPRGKLQKKKKKIKLLFLNLFMKTWKWISIIFFSLASQAFHRPLFICTHHYMDK